VAATDARISDRCDAAVNRGVKQTALRIGASPTSILRLLPLALLSIENGDTAGVISPVGAVTADSIAHSTSEPILALVVPLGWQALASNIAMQDERFAAGPFAGNQAVTTSEPALCGAYPVPFQLRQGIDECQRDERGVDGSLRTLTDFAISRPASPAGQFLHVLQGQTFRTCTFRIGSHRLH